MLNTLDLGVTDDRKPAATNGGVKLPPVCQSRDEDRLTPASITRSQPYRHAFGCRSSGA